MRRTNAMEVLKNVPENGPGDMVRNKYGYHASNYELAALFNVCPGHHLPDKHMETMRQGIRVVLLSKAEAAERGLFHRMMQECHGCGKLIPAGRMHQHVPACMAKLRDAAKQIIDLSHQSR